MRKKPKYKNVILALAVILVLSVIASFALGRYPVTVGELFSMIGNRIRGMLGGANFNDAAKEKVVFNVRFPRILIACFVGCCLSAAGASYQGVFQNPMASPDILGASSGACFGAALAILLRLPTFMTTLFAFISSLACVCLVIFVSSRAKGKRVMNLILSGIMLSSLFSAATSFIKLVADPSDQLPAITYWLMGSFEGVKKTELLFVVIPMMIGLVPLFLLRWKMNVLTLGDDEARTMGVNAPRVRTTVIIASTLVTAAAVSVSGMIGWVGLVIPHLARRLVGNNYRQLMPAAMLFGAVFMLLTDNICRSAASTEIPIGILTAFIGAPFFIYLITREDERF